MLLGRELPWPAIGRAGGHGVVPPLSSTGSQSAYFWAGGRYLTAAEIPSSRSFCEGPEYNLSHPQQKQEDVLPTGDLAPCFTLNSLAVPTVLNSDPNLSSGGCRAGFVLCPPVCLWTSKSGAFLPLFASSSLCTIRSSRTRSENNSQLRRIPLFIQQTGLSSPSAQH